MTRGLRKVPQLAHRGGAGHPVFECMYKGMCRAEGVTGAWPLAARPALYFPLNCLSRPTAFVNNFPHDSLTNANEQLLLANGSLTVTVVSG
eukprot:gene9969-biopygen9539